MTTHLCILNYIDEIEEERQIKYELYDKRILAITSAQWFIDYANYMLGETIFPDFNSQRIKKKFLNN